MLPGRASSCGRPGPCPCAFVGVSWHLAVEAKHDVLIVGAGCAGMRAAIEAFDAGADVAVVSKIHPTRSHSGAAEGASTRRSETPPRTTRRSTPSSTVKGSDYLGDQDAIEVLCDEAPDDVYQLDQGRRLLADGGRPDRAAPVRRRRQDTRTAYAADITGHVLVHVLYEQMMKRDVTTYEEWFAWSSSRTTVAARA